MPSRPRMAGTMASSCAPLLPPRGGRPLWQRRRRNRQATRPAPLARQRACPWQRSRHRHRPRPRRGGRSPKRVRTGERGRSRHRAQRGCLPSRYPVRPRRRRHRPPPPRLRRPISPHRPAPLLSPERRKARCAFDWPTPGGFSRTRAGVSRHRQTRQGRTGRRGRTCPLVMAGRRICPPLRRPLTRPARARPPLPHRIIRPPRTWLT